MKALIIEDDAIFANSVVRMLEKQGINCDVCDSAEDGISLVEAWVYDVILLDMCLKGMDGNELIEKVRSLGQQNRKNIPIIVLSNLEDKETKLRALHGGADDFICKPIIEEELISRILAVTRRYDGHSQNNIIIGDLNVDLRARSVHVKGVEICFSAKEYELFSLLVRKENNTLKKTEILDSLYGGEKVPGFKIIDVLICNIRKQLSKYTKEQYVFTVWGSGYKIANKSIRLHELDEKVIQAKLG